MWNKAHSTIARRRNWTCKIEDVNVINRDKSAILCDKSAILIVFSGIFKMFRKLVISYMQNKFEQ